MVLLCGHMVMKLLMWTGTGNPNSAVFTSLFCFDSFTMDVYSWPWFTFFSFKMKVILLNITERYFQ